ncbi:putative LRR receptor-like serine/threonine-protein kinase [Hordeum vulgare]|nr:putative LRR receptor-like serine/threonine-protein kinase [Hordeum vulgare]
MLSCVFNRIEGSIPDELAELGGLEILYLGSNLLAGKFPPAILNLSSLIGLGLNTNILKVARVPQGILSIPTIREIGLSSNNLHRQLPAEVGNAKQLVILLLSANKLSGDIPSTVGACKSMEDIELDNNVFNGNIPNSFGNLFGLKVLNLSYNNLTGLVPASLGNLQLLEKIDLSFNHLDGKRKNHLKRSMSSLSFDGKFPKVSYKDLARATDGFLVSNLIGTGRYSSVYRGKILQEENEVAVKVFCLETRGAQRSFIAECNALRNVRHRNLVRISTACSSIDSSENDFKALVYEFMRGGDSHNLLYSMEDNGNSLKLSYLSLAQRLSIVVDVADAMEYLHHNHHGSIVHCDPKPSNILLDNDMVAHVGDFGLARLQVYPVSSSFGDSTSVSLVAIRGTRGYVAPEYGSGGQVSTAVDVYSFGVVLLEIFIRKSPTDGMFKDGLSIAKFAEVNFLDKMMQIVDPQLVQELDLCEEAPSSKDIGLYL